jgi:hypothetical protein
VSRAEETSYFRVNTLLASPVEHEEVNNDEIYEDWSFRSDLDNVQPITKDQLKDSDKAEFEAHMEHYEELCLASYGQTKSGVFKKNPLPTLSYGPPHGSPHVSRHLSHRVPAPHSTSTSHMASAMLAGPMRKLSPHAGLARRSSPTTLRTPTPPPATARTPPTSSTSGWILTYPSPRNPRLNNRCQDQPHACL